MIDFGKSNDVRISLRPTDWTGDIVKMDKLFTDEIDKMETRTADYTKEHFRPWEDWDALDATCKERKHYYIVLEKDSVTERVGFITTTPGFRPKTMWLSSFYVQKHSRGKGIGGVVLHQLKDMVKEGGYNRLFLNTLSASTAQRLYRKMGFETEVSVVLLAKL